MKKIVYLLFATILCCSLTCCITSDGDNSNNKNDNNNGGSNKEVLIVGTWNNYKDWEEGYGYENYDEGEYAIRFKSDGSGYWIYEGEVEDRFEWSVDGSIIYFEYDFDDIESAKIKTLNNNELVLSYDDGEYIEYYHRAK